jgi:hypothetical protein
MGLRAMQCTEYWLAEQGKRRRRRRRGGWVGIED